MSKPTEVPGTDQIPQTARRVPDEKAERLAAALRENLKRRKAADRARLDRSDPGLAAPGVENT